MTRCLVAGWFSFEGMGATAGDILAAELAGEWLTEAGRFVDMARVAPIEGGVDLDAVEPGDYDELVFVCGPFGNGAPITELLERFAHCRLIGLDLSMLDPVATWNPFDVLIERDSERASNPDLSFAATVPSVPVVGLIEVHPQTEYGDRARHGEVGRAIRAALDAVEAAVVPIDTLLEDNATGLRSAPEVGAVIGRMDAVVTTRLHGLALALARHVPAVAVDPISGGAKVTRQAEALGWPLCVAADAAEPGSIRRHLEFCLTPAARELAARCADAGRARVDVLRSEFLSRLGES